MKLIFIGAAFLLSFSLQAQEHMPWREIDRKFLLTNLVRSRDEIIKETKGLTKDQWNYKPATDSGWSINQIIEHIVIWELLLDHEISQALATGLQPARMKTAPTDSSFIRFIDDKKPHFSLDYTRPFTYTIPLGLNEGENSMTQFQKMRNESVVFVKLTDDDLRAYFNAYGSVHQIYIYVWGHIDRHLRQIKKIKSEAKYPG